MPYISPDQELRDEFAARRRAREDAVRASFVEATSASEEPPAEETPEVPDGPRPNPVQGKSHIPKPDTARDAFIAFATGR